MAIAFFSGRESEHTHEMMARAKLIEVLHQAFAGSDDFVAAVFDFSFGVDVDLAIFKHNAIVVVELKECNKPIAGGENGQWSIVNGAGPAAVLKGGRKANPFQQVKEYRYELIRFLDKHRGEFLPPQKAPLADFAHVSAAVVLSPEYHPDSHLDFDFRRLPWFHIASLSKLPALVQQLRSRQINLSDDEIRCLVLNVLRCAPLTPSREVPPLATKDVAPQLTQPAGPTTSHYVVPPSFVLLPPKNNEPPQGDHKKLNQQQRDAVEHSGSHLLILAGAGTGKTTILASRAAHLLGDCQPSQMLLMTFTNKAAREMRQRIRSLRPDDVSQMWVGTFHSICRRILVEHATKLGYSSKFAIVDEGESREVMTRCAPRGIYVDVKGVLNIYNFSRNAMKCWQDVWKLPSFRHINVRESVISSMLASYQRRLKRSDRMDFDDLLVNTVGLLEQYPEIKTAYQQRFRYILVDEYQDTCSIQAHILSLLAGRDNVTVVGDDSQAIYGFRAASVDHILHFEEEFPNASRKILEENHRSTPEILDIANANIEHNRIREPKRLFAHVDSSHGERPWFCQCLDQHREANFVVLQVIDLHKLGLQFKGMAVLFRSNGNNSQTGQLELALKQAGIPFEVVGAPPFFAQEHIKDILAWLRLSINPNDTISLGRVLRQQQGISSDLFSLVGGITNIV